MRRILLLSGLVALLALSALAQGNWTTTAVTSFAGGLGEAVVGTPDGHICVLGQDMAAEPLSLTCYQVEANGSLTRTTDFSLPGSRVSPPDFESGTALVTVPANPDYIYALLGGSNQARGRAYFYRYDLSTESWTQMADTPSPFEQGAGDALTYAHGGGQDYLFALVGAAAKERPRAENGFLLYNTATDRWRSLPAPWLCADGGAALAWDGGEYIYALRGSDCKGNPSTDFRRYHIDADRWESLAPIPQPVDAGGSLVWDGGQSLYAITGGGEMFEQGGSAFYRYDLAAQQWEALPSLACPAGHYVGNRLAFVHGFLFYWQGAPSTWPCNGWALLRYTP
jgi:hypothetical protein